MMRETKYQYRPDLTYNFFSDMTFEIDHSPLATLTADYFQVIDNLNAEDYAYYLAHGEVPASADRADQTEAA